MIEIEIGWKLAVVIVIVAVFVAAGIAQRKQKTRKPWPDREDV